MPIYEPQDYEEVVKRIREKVSSLNIEMGERLTEEAILSFESRCKVQLPQAYRIFLKQVGNGCTHMVEGCRLNRLENIAFQDLSRPFMLEEAWIWEDDDRDEETIKAEIDSEVYQGNIELINLGDNLSYNLIATGKCQGEVWNFSDVGVQPCCERQDFLGWFELWLDCQDETDYFRDYIYE